MICKQGGFVILRHNSLRDTTAKLLEQICKDVETEPPLLPVTGERLTPGSNISDNARLDISARNLWTLLASAFIDIRIFHPQAPSNSSKSIPQMYRSHEMEKKRQYNSRVLEIEKATFTPVVFSTSGGMGTEAAALFKKVAEKISWKTGQNYCDVMAFIRRRLRFDLLKTSPISVRGHRGKIGSKIPKPMNELDLNLRRRATQM